MAGEFARSAWIVFSCAYPNDIIFPVNGNITDRHNNLFIENGIICDCWTLHFEESNFAVLRIQTRTLFEWVQTELLNKQSKIWENINFETGKAKFHYLFQTPLNFKMGQGHRTRYERGKNRQSYHHAEFAQFLFINIIQEILTLKDLQRQEARQLSPLKIRWQLLQVLCPWLWP